MLGNYASSKFKLCVLLLVLLQIRFVFAGEHYVSPEGTASWDECVNISMPCSLDTANQKAQAGDTVYLRGGVYNTHIFPQNSGIDVNHRIIYTAYYNEKPIIRNTATNYATYYHGILLRNKNYIKISGITIDNPVNEVPGSKSRLMMITHGSSYNEISNCTIDGNGSGKVVIWDGLLTDENDPPCTNNWIHDSIIMCTGQVSPDCDDLGGMKIGVPEHDSGSGHNTIENNIFFCGGHHNLETFTKYNVIRNNYFHDEGCMPSQNSCKYGPDDNGLYGNRNIQIYDGHNEDKYNLLEGNRFGRSGPPPDDNGGDGLTITAPKNIIRYNLIYDAQNNGVLFKTGYLSYSDDNRFYNNTIYKSGRYKNYGSDGMWQGWNIRWYGSYKRKGNVLKNNILYDYGEGGADWGGGSGTIYQDNMVINNWCTDSFAVKCVGFGNPLFVNPDVSDPTSTSIPDLSLRPDSPCIDKGIYLTKVSDSDLGEGIDLVVDDALYFQDGTWGSELSNVQADWIAIGTAENVVQIDSIDYESNTITLKNSVKRNSGDHIWLYKDSMGRRVFYGVAPDIGAYEYSYANGDVNQDGSVDINDVQLVVNVILGNAENSRADVNGDGSVTISDAQEVVNSIIG